MALYAVEEIDNAVEATKKLLLPFEKGTWLRLGLIVLITGSGMGGGNFTDIFRAIGNTGSTFDSGGYSGSEFGTSMAAQLPDFNSITGLATAQASPFSGGAMAALVAVMILILLLVLLKLILQPFFEFVYYQSLLDRNVKIRENLGKHSGKGLRYFFFLLITGLAKIAPLGLALYLLITGSGATAILLFVVWMLFLIPFNIFLGLTQNFVLLRMMENNSGLIEAWKSFYPVVKEQLNQIAAYVLIRFVLKIVIGIGTAIAAIIISLLLLIPFGILGLAAWMIAEWILLAPVIALGLITFIAIFLGLGVMIQTFYRYYSILVYHELTS